MDKPFWIVWGGSPNGIPVVRHDSLATAQSEAERLARCNRGTEFYVLSSVSKCKVSDVIYTDLRPSDDDLPF